MILKAQNIVKSFRAKKAVDNVSLEVKQGEIIFVGDKAKLTELLSLLDDFKLWFNLVTPVDS